MPDGQYSFYLHSDDRTDIAATQQRYDGLIAELD